MLLLKGLYMIICSFWQIVYNRYDLTVALKLNILFRDENHSSQHVLDSKFSLRDLIFLFNSTLTQYLIFIHQMSHKQIAKKVIDFEFSRISAPAQPEQKAIQDNDQYQHRYALWNLNGIIADLNLYQKSYDLHWIGYGDKNLLPAFFYCLLSGNRASNPQSSNNKFTRTKYTIYQMAQKYLNYKQQKQLVESLSYSQYTKSISTYLNKNYTLEQLMQKIFKSYIQGLKQSLEPLEQIKLFASNFLFVNFDILNQSVGHFSHIEHNCYIIIQKMCVFVLELTSTNTKNAMTSSVPYSNVVSRYTNSGNHIECSTPKFLPHIQTVNTSSSHKRKGHKQKNCKTLQIQVPGFEEKQSPQKKPEIKKNLYLQKVSKQRQKVREKVKCNPQTYKKKKVFQKSPNISLRNTIDMHIANLQKYQIRYNMKKKERATYFKSSSKDKQKSMNRTEVFSNPNLQIHQSSGTSVHKLSPQPSPINKKQSMMREGNKFYQFWRSHNIPSKTQSSKNKTGPNGTKVSFTYFSP